MIQLTLIKKTAVIFLLTLCIGQIAHGQPQKNTQAIKEKQILESGLQDRVFWSDLLYKIASPVIFNLAAGTLKQNMPVEQGKAAGYNYPSNKVTHLEAVGRTMAGIAPWLALPDDETKEGHQRKQLRGALLKGIKNAVDPSNPDYLNFRTEQQPIVDAAYMAEGFLRAPKALWEPLDDTTKHRVVEEFKSLRNRAPTFNNWLLFSAITEAFLMSIGEQYDPARIDFAVRKVNEWYAGDGWYNDGVHFCMDYYNSYVIHPMMVDIYKVLLQFNRVSETDYQLVLKRMTRYSEFQERIINADGSYPAFGRSITYRTGAFQALAYISLLGNYPEKISPAQIRCGLTAVIKKMFSFCNNFDDKGWLILGFCGAQPTEADYYTSTGSLYMATLAFLPLGLPATDNFWTSAPEDWTAKKAWSGQPFKKDYKVEY